jgi:hypothetical protein
LLVDVFVEWLVRRIKKKNFKNNNKEKRGQKGQKGGLYRMCVLWERSWMDGDGGFE